MNGARTPVLLADAGFYGTLAAARTLSRYGVPVTVIDSSRSAPALWSRHVTRRLRCPPFADLDRFVHWLVGFGDSNPRHVVLATSDDMSFALALHRDWLADRLVIGQPDLVSLIRILDKGRLLEDARAVGLDVPDTWLPHCDDDVDRAAREADGPLVVKPRTQVLLTTHGKGTILNGAASDIRAAYSRFRRLNPYGLALSSRFPEATWPMLQRYHPRATDGIYSLTGFRDSSGERFAVLAATKVLQRPPKLGIGLCFEEAPVDAALAAGVRRLCERVGYFGIFEAEFIREADRSLLIDLNGRLYNQVAFDVARGLPLPLLAYSSELNRPDEVARLLQGSNDAGDSGGPRGFCNRFGLEVLLGAKRLTGTMSQSDAARWRSWCHDREGRMVDAVADWDDPRPFAFDVAAQVYDSLRHPISFVRKIALDG